MPVARVRRKHSSCQRFAMRGGRSREYRAKRAAGVGFIVFKVRPHPIFGGLVGANLAVTLRTTLFTAGMQPQSLRQSDLDPIAAQSQFTGGFDLASHNSIIAPVLQLDHPMTFGPDSSYERYTSFRRFRRHFAPIQTPPRPSQSAGTAFGYRRDTQ